MVSIVNEGVQSGGGASGATYGPTIVDLFGQYVTLLYERAAGGLMDPSPGHRFGPLGFGAISLEVFSIACAAYAIVSPAFTADDVRGKAEENSTTKGVTANGGATIRDEPNMLATVTSVDINNVADTDNSLEDAT